MATDPAPGSPTPLVSASQVSSYAECQRKWAFKYIARHETAQTEAQKLGDDVDEGQLQPYLRDGRPFDYTRENESGYIAASALAYLPKPQSPGLEVQKHFTLPAATARRPDGSALFGYQGYQDLWMPLREHMPAAAFDADELTKPPASYLNFGTNPPPVVVDFKTTVDLKWAKGRAALRKDPQAMLYATWAMYETGARAVDLVWIYMRTRGARQAKRTHLRVYATDVLPQFQAIDAIANEMFGVRQAGDAATDKQAFVLSLPPTPSACESFGGCPHRHVCNLSPLDVLDSHAAKDAALTQLRRKDTPMSNTTASLFANLQKKSPADAAPAPPTPAPAAPTMGVSDRDVPAVSEATLPDWAKGGPATQVLPINPPESALPPAPPVGAVAAPAPAAEPPKAAPARRGRPPKAKPDPLGADAHAATSSAAPEKTSTGESDVGDRSDEPVEVSGGLDIEPEDTPRETVTVTWAEERFSPIQYNSFGVGPFSMTGKVRAGETTTDAARRIYAELEAFAGEARLKKAQSFAAALGGKS